MNLLTEIFLERFGNRRYYDSTGRSYVEYILEKEKGYTGKICFFHFSEIQERKNSYMNLEILSFIRAFYSQGYQQLYPLLKYAIQKDIVVTFNSFTEYEFLVKFQNQDNGMNLLVEKFIQQHTHTDFQIKSDGRIRFYEMIISLKPYFSINTVKIYSEDEVDISPYYEDSYIEKENVFMTLKVDTTTFQESIQKETGILIKFTQPFSFKDSVYLTDTYQESLEQHFDLENIYLAFVEKTQGNENDVLYFTDGFLIPA